MVLTEHPENTVIFKRGSIMKHIRRIGKYYTGIIMKNIGIFLCIGLLLVLFGEQGWMPDTRICEVAMLLYQVILPTMIAYEGGAKLAGTSGGILAVLALAGALSTDSGSGLFGAMVIGPLAGYLWRQIAKWLEKTDFRMKMLVWNLSLAVCGGVLLLLAHTCVLPVLEWGIGKLCQGVHFLIAHHMTFAASILLEPAKVFFLNNLMNHGIFVPLGMSQVQETGSSVLFLMETNPGPGLGVLLALYFRNKEYKSEYVSAMLAQSVGGIHEVYFPFVLSDLRLLLPLILGGMAGNICFELLGAGTKGVVSPGSFLVILLMAGKEGFFPALAGMAASAAVSFAGSLFLLGAGGGKEPKRKPQEEEVRDETAERETEELQADETPKEQVLRDDDKMQEKKRIEQIAFGCDGGVGSSVMGAALLRRLLAQKGIEGIKVQAFAVDLVPQEIEVLVCQKDFYRMLPEELLAKEILTVDSLVQPEGFAQILEQIEQRNG